MRRIIFLLLALTSFSALAENPVVAIRDFQPEKYVGTWYEVARLPMFFERNCRPPIMANYRIDPNNTYKIIVNNSCRKADGDTSVATGIAAFTDTSNIAELTVTFLPTLLRWLPFTHGDYWVLYTDYTHYALVGAPNRKYLWILSRTEKNERKDVMHLIQLAQTQGFPTEQLIFN